MIVWSAIYTEICFFLLDTSILFGLKGNIADRLKDGLVSLDCPICRVLVESVVINSVATDVGSVGGHS